MSDSLGVDTALAHAFVNELAALADSAQQDLNRLKETLQREGAAWGDDEPGRRIGETYEPEAEKGLTGFQNLVDNMRGLSAGVSDATKTLAEQDQIIANQVNAAGQNVSGSTDVLSTGPVVVRPIAQTGYTPQSVLSSSVPQSTAAPQSTTDGSTASPGVSDSSVTSEQTGHQPSADPDLAEQPESGTADPVDGTATPDGGQTDPGVAAPQAVQGGVPQAVSGGAPQAGRGTVAPAAGIPPAGARPTPGVAGTPWSAGAISTPRSVAGTPWSSPGSGVPGQVIPPRRNDQRPGAAKRARRDAKARKRDRVSVKPTGIKAAIDGAAVVVAGALAVRHGLRIVGFDSSGITESTVAEMAAAIDDILGKYPFLELGGIEIAELGGGEISEVMWDRPVDEMVGAKTAAWIMLDRFTVENTAVLTEKVGTAAQSGSMTPGSTERPMYSVMVHDFGRILEVAAGPQPRLLAQRALITEYQRVSGPWAGAETLARVVSGYRQWRAHLGVVGDRFMPGKALVVAFTEVELRGEDARGPAKALHRLVVERARERSSSR